MVIASSRSVAKRIKELLLSDAGVEVKIANGSTDLGLQLNLSGSRDTTLSGKRLRQAGIRFDKIKGLMQVNKRARRLAVAAGLSKATWGRQHWDCQTRLWPNSERRWQRPQASTSLADAAALPSSLHTGTGKTQR